MIAPRGVGGRATLDGVEEHRFRVAGAVVVDVGAMNSHAVVVSRELGIPSVLSVTTGTAQLSDGMEVTVDGVAGTVTVVSTAGAATV